MLFSVILVFSFSAMAASAFEQKDCMIVYNRCSADWNEQARRGIYPDNDCSERYGVCMQNAEAPTPESLEPGYQSKLEKQYGMIPGFTADANYVPLGTGYGRQARRG